MMTWNEAQNELSQRAKLALMLGEIASQLAAENVPPPTYVCNSNDLALLWENDDGDHSFVQVEVCTLGEVDLHRAGPMDLQAGPGPNRHTTSVHPWPGDETLQEIKKMVNDYLKIP